MSRWTAVLVLMCLLVLGCSTMKPEEFADREPRLVIEDYFNGHTRAWGIFEDRFGRLRRQFVVDIEGQWDGEQLTLDEHFTYADGDQERRVWRITKTGEGTYQGRADDVIGHASGEAAGNALNWRYDLDLKVGEETWRVHFNDWMFLQPDNVLLNRARVTKWGIEIGEVTIVFNKGAPATVARPMPAGELAMPPVPANGVHGLRADPHN